jgi:cytochrome c oxidase cbb3-type subunit 4
MEHYSFLREFADSWGLLAMMLFFVGAIAFLFRPGAKVMHENAASIPLRDDTFDRSPDDENTNANKTNGLESEDAK